jgi:hypothetical protein
MFPVIASEGEAFRAQFRSGEECLYVNARRGATNAAVVDATKPRGLFEHGRILPPRL